MVVVHPTPGYAAASDDYFPESKFASLSIGFAGVWGTLAGASQGHLTVHEAGLDTK